MPDACVLQTVCLYSSSGDGRTGKASFLAPDALELIAQSGAGPQRAGPNAEPVCQPAASLRGMETALVMRSESLPACRFPSSLGRAPPAPPGATTFSDASICEERAGL